jgi:hypothetical protein
MSDAGESVSDYEDATIHTELLQRKIPRESLDDEFGSPDERRRLEVRVCLAITFQFYQGERFLTNSEETAVENRSAHVDFGGDLYVRHVSPTFRFFRRS